MASLWSFKFSTSKLSRALSPPPPSVCPSFSVSCVSCREEWHQPASHPGLPLPPCSFLFCNLHPLSSQALQVLALIASPTPSPALTPLVCYLARSTSLAAGLHPGFSTLLALVWLYLLKFAQAPPGLPSEKQLSRGWACCLSPGSTPTIFTHMPPAPTLLACWRFPKCTLNSVADSYTGLQALFSWVSLPTETLFKVSWLS